MVIQRGYQGTKTAEVASAAGVSRGTPAYFDSNDFVVKRAADVAEVLLNGALDHR